MSVTHSPRNKSMWPLITPLFAVAMGVLVFTAILVTFDLLRLPVAPATQEILLWLYVAFVGGNAVEHTVRSKGGAA